MRTLLTPTWGRVVVTAVFCLTAAGAFAQTWAGVPPKPPLYELLRPLSLADTWGNLVFPAVILSAFLTIAGLDVKAADLWLLSVAHGVYFYSLASLLVAAFGRYRSRLRGWLWAAILIAPYALYTAGSLVFNSKQFQPFDLLSLGRNVLGQLPALQVESLYLFLLVCLGMFVRDTSATRGEPQSLSLRPVGCVVLSVPAFGCLALTLLLAVYPHAFVWPMVLISSGPQSDGQLMSQQFAPQLPGFSDAKILERAGDASRSGRVLTFTVTIDGYPEPVACQGVIRYIHGDPSRTDVTWPEKECALQNYLVRNSQYVLNERAGGPTPPQADSLARILLRWSKQGRIAVSDIRHPEMRAMVEQLLESEAK
jgi:hypothetical protein